MRAAAAALVVTLGFSLACSGVEVSDLDAKPATASASGPSKLPALTANTEPYNEDCQLPDPREWDPMLAAKQTNGSAPVVVKINSALAETMRMNDGTEVRITRGGCAHVGETWWISPVPDKPHVAAVRALINRVDLRDPTEQPSLLSCLNDEHEGDDNFDCGEAHVSKTIDDGVLIFTWSFAL